MWRQNGWKRVAIDPNWLFFAMHKIFLVRFGAIWCDLVLSRRFFAVGAAIGTADRNRRLAVSVQ
jgi:hypothetical protein